MRVLVVDDEADVRSVVSRSLAADGHVIVTASDLASARQQSAEGVDLIVLDLHLPDGFGLEFCRDLRQQGSTIPILLLTALSQVKQRVEGFNAGADDFLAKPFALAELRARVRALGRRGTLPRGIVHIYQDIVLDFAARRARRANLDIAITAREWAILEFLAQRSGRVVSRLDLVESVWGGTAESAFSSLEVLIARLRRKLGAELIKTLRGEGYSLAGEKSRDTQG